MVVADAGATYPLTIDPLLTSVADALLESNQRDSFFGMRVAGAGDVNGDGYSDVLVGAHAYDNQQGLSGTVFVYHGGAGGVNTTAAILLKGYGNMTGNMTGFGRSVAGAGDVNGDGYSDVLVGVVDYGELTDLGAVLVYHGGAGGVNPTAATLLINQTGVEFGFSIAGAGDVNGDGYSDVLVGAHHYPKSVAGISRGATFVYHGGANGVNPTAVTLLQGNQVEAYFGISVAGAGDVNGDGYSDVLVGAPGTANALQGWRKPRSWAR